MHVVRNHRFCRRRTEPACFAPEVSVFPCGRTRDSPHLTFEAGLRFFQRERSMPARREIGRTAGRHARHQKRTPGLAPIRAAQDLDGLEMERPCEQFTAVAVPATVRPNDIV